MGKNISLLSDGTNLIPGSNLATNLQVLDISQRENGRGSNESWLIFQSETLTFGDNGRVRLTPPHIHDHISL